MQQDVRFFVTPWLQNLFIVNRVERGTQKHIKYKINNIVNYKSRAYIYGVTSQLDVKHLYSNEIFKKFK